MIGVGLFSGREEGHFSPSLIIMGDIRAIDKLIELANGIRPMLVKEMDFNRNFIRIMIQQQLLAGRNGNDNPLRPTYETDPYFKEGETGSKKNKKRSAKEKAVKYKRWKADITPPREYLGYPPRDKSTPNLFITGAYYDSIKPVMQGEKVIIKSDGSFPDSADIMHKYGPIHLGLGTNARKKMYEDIFLPALKRYFEERGYV